jgi:hypothetical protein
MTMSSVFRPEQNLRINATDDPELAKLHGLTEWDESRGQYVRPVKSAPSTVGESSAEPVSSTSSRTRTSKKSDDASS